MSASDPKLTDRGDRAGLVPCLQNSNLEQHPDKTFVGRIERGFDFLGYHFDGSGLSVAQATVERFMEHATRLYEQERLEPDGPASLRPYVRRWMGWVCGRLGHPLANPLLRYPAHGVDTGKQKPRRSGVSVSTLRHAGGSFFLRPTHPSSPKPSPIIA